eukprot:492403_1
MTATQLNTPFDDEGKDETKQVDLIPSKYLCPITKKIMSYPVMAVYSGKIYDILTISIWLAHKNEHLTKVDPMTGIPLCTENKKPLIMKLPELKSEINQFLKDNPQHTNKALSAASDIDNWKAILFDDAPRRFQQFIEECRNQMERVKNKGLPFLSSCDDEKCQQIHWNNQVPLHTNFKYISFIGPSRNGKSTLLNDIMGKQDVFDTDDSPDISCTKGVFAALFDHNKKGKTKNIASKSFFLLDNEGLSHNVTELTKKLFYASYAISDVMVWNDIQINSDYFKALMGELKEEMKEIASSDRKPAFIYLKRDRMKNDKKKWRPYKTIDEYVQKSDTFYYLRELNIFSSISGYTIDERDPEDGFDFDELKDLMSFIFKRSQKAKRFVLQLESLSIVINKINKKGLSVDLKSVLDDNVLKWFIYDDLWIWQKKRQIMKYASLNDWDHKRIEKKYNEALTKSGILELCKKGLFDKGVYNQLDIGARECVDAVKNKRDTVEILDIVGGTVSEAFDTVCEFTGINALDRQINSGGLGITTKVICFGLLIPASMVAFVPAYAAMLGGAVVGTGKGIYKKITAPNDERYTVDLKLDDK